MSSFNAFSQMESQLWDYAKSSLTFITKMKVGVKMQKSTFWGLQNASCKQLTKKAWICCSAPSDFPSIQFCCCWEWQKREKEGQNSWRCTDNVISKSRIVWLDNLNNQDKRSLIALIIMGTLRKHWFPRIREHWKFVLLRSSAQEKGLKLQ